MKPLAFAGVDISYVQKYIDLSGYADQHELIILKASEGWGIKDAMFDANEAATRTVKYRGFYHFLTFAPAAEQLSRFASVIDPVYRGAGSPDFLIVDWESVKGLGQVPQDIAYEMLDLVQERYPDKPIWLYGYRSILFREQNTPRLARFPRWVASYDVLEDAQALNAVIDQYGTADSLPPYYGGTIDVNRVLSPDLLHSLVYGTQPTQEQDVNPVQYHEGGDGPAKTDSAENALGWTTDNAALAVRYSQSAAALAAQTLAAVKAIPAQAGVSLHDVSSAALLAELASRVTS